MRRIRHWTPRYLVDRLIVLAYERSHPHSPWLNRHAVHLLDSWLQPGDKGFEWGSGRSTLWLARRVRWLLSVEHSEPYYLRTRSQLAAAGLHHVDYRHCPQEADYVGASNSLPPQSLDFVLVDGQRRDHCALAALPRLKPGGLLILDNSNWFLPSHSRSPNSRRWQHGPASEAWSEFARQVETWRCLWTSDGVSDTAFWLKPA